MAVRKGFRYSSKEAVSLPIVTATRGASSQETDDRQAEAGEVTLHDRIKTIMLQRS